MKNLMKAARIRTTDSCPTMRPCVKDSLRAASAFDLFVQNDEYTHAGSGLVGQVSAAIISVGILTASGSLGGSGNVDVCSRAATDDE
jgi:hypothetical protein